MKPQPKPTDQFGKEVAAHLAVIFVLLATQVGLIWLDCGLWLAAQYIHPIWKHGLGATSALLHLVTLIPLIVVICSLTTHIEEAAKKDEVEKSRREILRTKPHVCEGYHIRTENLFVTPLGTWLCTQCVTQVMSNYT